MGLWASQFTQANILPPNVLKRTLKDAWIFILSSKLLYILCLRASDADGNGGLIAAATAPAAHCECLQRPCVLAAMALPVRVVLLMVAGGRLMGLRGVAVVGGGQEAGSAVQRVDVAVLHTAVGFRHHKLE